MQPWKLEPRDSEELVITVQGAADVPRVPALAYAASGPAAHDWPRAASFDPPQVSVSRARDVTVVPRNVFLNARGEVMRRSFAAGRFRNEGLKRLQGVNRYFSRAVIAGAPVARIEGPAFVADTPWPDAYGHVLLEVVPTAMLMGYCPPGTVFITSAPPTRTILLMLEQLEVEPSRFRQIAGPITCSDLYFGDRLARLSGQIHPLAREAFAKIGRLGKRGTVERHDRVFLSRSGATARRLDIEAEVEALFARYGFAIVHPETLEIEDQIALVAGARMLAGLGGSAMHNAVFARPDCPVLIVQPRLMSVAMDMGINDGARRLGYVFGDSEPMGDRFVAPWHVDIRDVEQGIKAHFGF